MSIKRPTKYLSASQWSVRAQDLCIASAFAVWSVILGLSPVLVFHALLSA